MLVENLLLFAGVVLLVVVICLGVDSYSKFYKASQSLKEVIIDEQLKEAYE